MSPIPIDFYQQENVHFVAKSLLGSILLSKIDGLITAGKIVETEAYAGVTDRASHAFGGRRTKRTDIMYRAGGAAYVYLCYGIYHLFNVVTGLPEIPHAVLIRAIEPLEGVETMFGRRKNVKSAIRLGNGPGIFTQSMGITVQHTGHLLDREPIWLEFGEPVPETDIHTASRIGVDYAGEDALLPWRYFLDGNKFVSRKT
jgi:DNA-3-methyladenine glycosylase